jgi:hypothetical protein
MTDLDAYSRLPELKWRGVEYPCMRPRYSFRHEDAEHKLSFGDVTIVEPLGPRNPTFEYVIPMRQGIARGPYEDLFLRVPQLEADCYNREPGELVDPFYGVWTVKPTSYSSTGDERGGRDGLDVQVAFVWAPELDVDVQRHGGIDTISDLRSDGAKLDEEVEALARKYDEPYPGPSIDAFDAPGAVLGQIDRQADRLSAQIGDFARRVEEHERLVLKIQKRTKDPDAFGTHRTARRIRASSYRTQKAVVDVTRNVGPITIAQAKSVLSVAAEAGMTVKDFLSLNTALASSPVVAAGTTVNVYQ